MRNKTKLSALVITATVVMALGANNAYASTPPPPPPTPTIVADWEMNDAPGTTVMTDSGPNHLNGTVSPGNQPGTNGVNATGTYFHWQFRCPACAPVDDTRVIEVPDPLNLTEPVDPAITYALEFMIRTNHSAGNVMQKGHSTTAGGQIKVQNVAGNVQCLFKGASGVRVGTGSSKVAPLNDNLWHDVRCVHTATKVQEYVDGVLVATKNGSTGPITNTANFTIGGKTQCDQVKITCDYYSGDLDGVTISTDAAPVG